MLREITKAIGRFRVGDVHDYPRGVWDKVARDAKQKLDAFTKEVPFGIGRQPATRQPNVARGRAGSTGGRRTARA